nr:glucosaminidase domain-containing protein [Secundilactobacillus kimchicus]
MNINLGLPTDLYANSVFLIYDLAAGDTNNKDNGATTGSAGQWNGNTPKTTNAALKKLGPLAEKYGAKYGVLPSMILAQAMLESGQGSLPHGYNYWGLTGNAAGHGTDGGYTKFVSLDEAVQYYTSAIGGKSPGKNHWKIKSIGGIHDAKKAIDILANDTGYHSASPASYKKALLVDYKQFNLKRYDKNVTW